MPISVLSSFTDELDPGRRSREHFITHTNLAEDGLWGPLSIFDYFRIPGVRQINSKSKTRRESMKHKKFFIKLRRVLAFASLCAMTSVYASAQERVLHSFANNGKDATDPLGGLIFDSHGHLYGDGPSWRRIQLRRCVRTYADGDRRMVREGLA